MSVEHNEDDLVDLFLKLFEDSPIQLDELSPELADRAYKKAYSTWRDAMHKRDERHGKGYLGKYTKKERRLDDRMHNIGDGSSRADRLGKTYDKAKTDAWRKEHEAKYGTASREAREKKKAAELAAFREKRAKLVAKKAAKSKASANEEFQLKETNAMGTEKYANYIAGLAHKERVMGFRPFNESTDDHIMVSHPHETLHAGDNKNRTGKSLTDRRGDFSKEYHNQAHHYNQILSKIGKHKDAKVHDGHEDVAGHISFKKGSAAHKAVEKHLQHVDHSSISHHQHKSGPNA